MGTDDAPAWCLRDVSPQVGDSELSLYVFPEDRSDELAPMVGAAIVAGGNELDHAEFLLFDESILTSVGLTATPSLGETPHEDVNRLHVSVSISAKRAAALAGAVYGRADIKRLLDKEVKALLIAARQKGKLNSALIRPKVQKALDAV
jgi:hypothetical protein